MGLIAFLLVGLVAGFIARALVPGPDPMGWLGTMVLGIVGSLVGGTLAALLFGGTLEMVHPGLAQYRLKSLKIRELSIPPPMIPKLIRNLDRGPRIVAYTFEWLPFLTLAYAHAVTKSCELRRVHEARVIVLVPGERQAMALDRPGDEEGRDVVLRRVEGFDQ